MKIFKNMILWTRMNSVTNYQAKCDIIDEGNRDLGLNRENTRLWTKMVNYCFQIEVSSCVNNNAIPCMNCNSLLIWNKLYDLICLREVDGWCV